ncbi:MAG: site-specific integrase [Flavobacteriaceae bacterium]|jgi:integrase|nr:site-specific integrase [Flavobacteriaceae bacterium]
MIFEFFLSQNTTLSNINLFISVKDFQCKFRIPLKLSKEQWNTDKQRPENIYIKKFKQINLILNLIKIEIIKYINDCNEKNKNISQKTIYGIIQKTVKEKKAIPLENSLLFFMQQYIDERKEFICNSTYKRYMVFFNLIQRFEGEIIKQLFIDDIDSKFIKDFIEFGKKEDYSENTNYRTLHFIKTILNFVERKGIRTRVREFNTRREKQQTSVVSLTEEEILKIEETIVPDEFQPAKDWLVISCYTGQRFSDFIRFSNQNIIEIKDKTCIRFIQKKTNKEILLPLHPTVKNIFKKNNNKFPRPLDMKTYNENIKSIAKLAGINHSLRAKKRIGHRIKDLMIEKWQAITSHIGRRSFASNFYGKIPTPLLMQATGHSTEQMFIKYINPVSNDRIISLSNHFEQVYKHRLNL